jgi:hypothetical protein
MTKTKALFLLHTPTPSRCCKVRVALKCTLSDLLAGMLRSRKHGNPGQGLSYSNAPQPKERPKSCFIMSAVGGLDVVRSQDEDRYRASNTADSFFVENSSRRMQASGSKTTLLHLARFDGQAARCGCHDARSKLFSLNIAHRTVV